MLWSSHKVDSHCCSVMSSSFPARRLLFLLCLRMCANDVEGFLLLAHIYKPNNRGEAQRRRPRLQRTQQQNKLYYKDDCARLDHDVGLVQRRPSPSRAIDTSSFVPMTPRGAPHVYCDLDGVLVDFCKGISEAFDVQMDSQNVDALPRNVMWKKVQQKEAFFENLSWCEGGKDLWNAIAPLKPSILTGVPSYCHRAPRVEKFAWCVRELSAERLVSFQLVDKAGPLRQHIPVRRYIKPARPWPSIDASYEERTPQWRCQVITCWSERKHHECRPGDILIDDRIDLKRPWESAGGTFIHHRTGDTAHTLDQLRSHGILSCVSENGIPKL